MTRVTRMTRVSRIVLSVLASVFTAADAAAQWNVARFSTERSRVYTSVGLDPATITTLGYGRVVQLRGHDFQVTADVGVAAAGLDAHDYRARIGAQTSLAQWRSVHLTGTATFITRGTENSIYRGLNFGADLTGTLGVYRPRWFAGSEFGFDKAIVTHVSHTDWYRQHFYPDAKDGWYIDTGGTYHVGLAGGYALGRTELVGRFGLLRTQRYRELGTPGYVSLGVGLGF
jgi:hypothetical protein